MKKFLGFFALVSVSITAWALYNSGVVFHQFKEVTLKGVLNYSKENCSVINDLGIHDGIDRSFCKEHFDKIGCNILVRGVRTDGEIIGQDCTNRLCFSKLNSEIFECKNERVVCNDLIEYHDPYNCVCEAPLNCEETSCATFDDHIRDIRQSNKVDSAPSKCLRDVQSILMSECKNGFILETDRGETIGFERLYFDKDSKMIGKYLLSDYGEFCGRSTMQKKIGSTFECLNRETKLVCGSSTD